MENTQIKSQKPQLGPYQEGVKKALSKSGEQHTLEAIMNGVPPEHIEQQSGLSQQQQNSQGQDDVLGQLLASPEAQKILALSQTQMKQPGTMQGPHAAFMSLLQGKPVSPFAQRTAPMGLDTATKLYGAIQTGEKNTMDMKKNPLEMKKLQQETDPNFQEQKLRREESVKSEFRTKEDDVKSENEYFKNLLESKPMAGESASKYNFTMEAKDSSQQLMELMKSNPKSLRELDIIGNNKGQRIGTIAARLKASLVPARAGATQSKQEIELIKKMSSPTGFAALLKDPEDLKFRLSEINRSMSRQAKVMNPTEEDRGLAKHLLAKGHSKSEVHKYLLSRGE